MKKPLFFHVAAGLLLLLMFALSGGAALRESVAIDEVAHIGAGLSYVQTFEMRLNEEHPPLAKVLTGISLALSGTRADYAHVSWAASRRFFPHGFLGEWVFGEFVLHRWNEPSRTLAWARFPMLLLTLLLGWLMYRLGRRLGGNWGGLLCLSLYVSAPVFLTFGPLVLTDVAITLFSLLSIWTFASLWREPSRRNIVSFGLCLAGALLSKFSAGLLFFSFGLFASSTRWWPIPGQPLTKPESRAWRKARWRATWKGIFSAAVIVYVVYFIFSWNQTTDVLYLVGHSSAWVPVRRLLMPPWLYLRGILMIAASFSRPAFILGHRYPHGTVLFFPVLFLLKSTLAFLLLLVTGSILAKFRQRIVPRDTSLVPDDLGVHWRALWTALVLFVIASILGHFDVSYRHFTIPVALMTLLMAPLPRLLEHWRRRSPAAARTMTAVVALLAVSSLVSVVRAYPHYFPYMNALAMGKPLYYLASDSNVDWNQALPEVKEWASARGLQKLSIDYYGFSDPALAIPNAELWNCQKPTSADAGQWVVVSSDMILDTHNCAWLLKYPHEMLAAGGMYAFQLPNPIPATGSPGGPPVPEEQREFIGFGGDTRVVFVELIRDPSKLPAFADGMWAQMEAQMKARQSQPK